MGKREEQLTKRRLRSSYLTTVVSISLVLFMLGLTGLLVLNAKKLSDYVKENIGFSIVFKENVKEVDINHIKKQLDATDYVKATNYITKEQAAKDLEADLGESFVEFLGYNPLSASIDVKLYADYANPESIAVIENKFRDYPQVKDVLYQQSLVHLVNENIRKLSFIILLFSAVLFFISFTLINNTIRLSVYSKRFLLNTMKLVGATRTFIRRPFLFKSGLHGIYGALLANALLIGVVFLAQKELKGVISFKDIEILGALFLLVTALGFIITWISTYFAVNKYLRIKEKDLYY